MKGETFMSKGNNNNLPAYTTVENILSLIDTLKRKNKNEDEAKAIFGKGGSAYINTKSALRAFSLIENESLDFTNEGREVAYSQGSNKKIEIIKILKNYPPYEVFLFSLLKKDDVTKTEIDEIVNFWGKAHYGSTQRNMEDAAKLFMSIIDFIEFGKYVIGRGKNSTRIEWATDIKAKISSLSQEATRNPIVEPETTTNSQEKETIEASIVDTSSVEEGEENPPAVSISDEKNVSLIKKPLSAVNMPNISINVDMSDWSDEKVKTFFKYAYGKFEED